MIKIFRRIRKQLVEKGYLKRYLIYAIGEILLVVLGILIALNINNRNQENNNRISENKIYQNIKQELNDDFSALNANLTYDQLYKNQYEYAVEVIEAEDISQLDSLGVIAINLLKSSDFHSQSTIYKTIVNSGQIKFLNNHDIIRKLHQLEETYIHINQLESIHLRVVTDFLAPMLVRTVKINTATIKATDKIFNYQFQNNFVVMINLMEEKEETYIEAIKDINSIIELIDIEISTNENQ